MNRMRILSDQFSKQFIEGIYKKDMVSTRSIPKSDLHNHYVMGGDRNYIFTKTGVKIPALKGTINSIKAMHDWYEKYIGNDFNNYDMQKILIEATFYQAKTDGIKLLEIGPDVWSNMEFFNGDVMFLIETFQTAQQKIAPDTELRLQIGLSRHCPVSYLEKSLEPFWKHTEFYSIDLYGDEFAQPIQNFAPIYARAKEHGLRLKAHIGEWGAAKDILMGIKALGLDEIQHGIAAISSPGIIEQIVKNNIRLNICPTSNLKLGRIASLKEHPIGALYHAGVNLTINSDDILIFGSEVSKEYMNLYEAGVLTAEELDEIRVNGLYGI